MLGQSSWNVRPGNGRNAATTISPRGRPAISRAGKIAAREPVIGEVTVDCMEIWGDTLDDEELLARLKDDGGTGQALRRL